MHTASRTRTVSVSTVALFLFSLVVTDRNVEARIQLTNCPESYTSVYHVEDLPGLRVDCIRHQESERTWIAIDNLTMKSYYDDPDYPLYNPGLITGDSRGNLFVFDYGDFILKQYNYDRGFEYSYGTG